MPSQAPPAEADENNAPRRLKPKKKWVPPAWNGQVGGSFAEAPGDARARERKERQERILAAKNKGPVIKPLPGQKKKVATAPRTAEEQAKRDEERAQQGKAKGLKHSGSFRFVMVARVRVVCTCIYVVSTHVCSKFASLPPHVPS